MPCLFDQWKSFNPCNDLRRLLISNQMLQSQATGGKRFDLRIKADMMK